MFSSHTYGSDWISSQIRTMGTCTPVTLEKCVYALTLLGYLAESGLPFLFKGGTSMLLHLEEVRRLSIDIDIVCGRPRPEVDAVLATIGQRAPFLRCEEDVRGERGLPKRRHFKFYYQSALDQGLPRYVLLDVVEEARTVHTPVLRLIRTSFLEPEREIRVQVPTVESLLGDKLNAFAPTTTGVPLRKPDNSPGEVLQVAKQLFDVGVLFEAATNFGQVAETYNAVRDLEASYRPNRPNREASLDDTFKACLALTANTPSERTMYPDADLLHEGFKKMRGHLTWPNFGPEDRRRMAARAAVLVAHLRAGRNYDFTASRYLGNPEQITALRAATLTGTPHAWLDGIKGVNAEAYHYWYLGLSPTA